MNFINLLSILESKNNLSDKLFKKYLEYQNVNLKDNEIKDLLKLIEKLVRENKSLNIFNGYYIGYEIPQISKEFDLLKITEKSVVNIELKSGADEKGIKKQLIHNKYYLSSLEKDKLYNITYQSSGDKFYILNEKEELNELEIEDLIKILLADTPIKVDLNTLFDPSEFLVSPFNNTDKFMGGEYFLTDQQKKFKKDIIKILEENNHGFCAISGKAGTGKTLLVYDIAKEMILNKKKVLVVHCGKLNNGHVKLKDEYKIDLIPIVSFTEEKINENYDLIIFDEAQRIYSKQLTVILGNNEKSNYLFSYDKTQILGSKDGRYGKNTAGNLFKENIKNHFELSKNIRTNKEIASFIRRFIDKKNNKSQRQYKNITIQNFENMDHVGDYVKNLEENGWRYIAYTSDLKREVAYEKNIIDPSNSLNAHGVIGQEFDNVVVIVGEILLYNKETGKLTYDSPKDGLLYYIPHKMLFQAMTRVRKKLKIIIVDNPDILERCMEILIESKKE